MKKSVYKMSLFLISMTFLIAMTNVNAAKADASNPSATATSTDTSSTTNNTYTPGDNSSSSNQTNSQTTGDNSSNNSTNAQPNVDTNNYYQVISTQSVSYSTKIKKTVNRYKKGPYNTSADNVKSFANTKPYLNKWVSVHAFATTKAGTYAHVFYKTKDLGWIKTSALDSSSYKINHVPLIGQLPQLPTGCEITAVTMMINYQNKSNLKKTDLAKEMPKSKNPNKGFVGDPFKKSGWYIFPPALMNLVKKHLGFSKLFTGKSTKFLKNYLRKTGHPLVVYVGDIDNFPNHAVTMTGFDKNHIYFNDPWTKKRTSLTNAKFEYHRKYVQKKAIGY